MSEDQTSCSRTRGDLVELAKLLISEKVDFFDGVRKLAAFISIEKLSADPQLFGILGIECQMDDFPIQTSRVYCHADYLERMDREMSEFKSEFLPDVWKRATT